VGFCFSIVPTLCAGRCFPRVAGKSAPRPRCSSRIESRSLATDGFRPSRAPGRWRINAWSGSSGVDAVVTALVLAASRPSVSALSSGGPIRRRRATSAPVANTRCPVAGSTGRPLACAAGNGKRDNKRVREVDGYGPDRSRWPAPVRLEALCRAYPSRLLEDDRVRNHHGYLRESRRSPRPSAAVLCDAGEIGDDLLGVSAVRIQVRVVHADAPASAAIGAHRCSSARAELVSSSTSKSTCSHHLDAGAPTRAAARAAVCSGSSLTSRAVCRRTRCAMLDTPISRR